MHMERSESNVADKWKSYITGIMTRNFTSLRKIDKYFRMDISDSMSKAIEENWIRLLGIDYQIIAVNMCKNNEPLGLALQGRNAFSGDRQEMIQRHYIRAIMSQFCIGLTNKFMVGDELLEVNGLKVYGMRSKDVVNALKKLPNYIQLVVARSLHHTYEEASDYGGSEEIHSPISFYDMDADISSRTSTLKSNSSLFSSTSRDYGSTVSVGGLIDGRNNNVGEYLRNIIGWRGPIVIEFRKRNKESLGLALEEINDPKTSQLIIVLKIVVPDMKASKDGRVHVGDRLLQVNGKSVSGVSFRKVCQWMKSSLNGRLVLYICKPHFPAYDMDNVDYLPDNYLYHTLTESDKLPKLREESNEEVVDTPPVPYDLENDIFIKGVNDSLGLFLDVVDNGNNGCRIRKITKGLAKNDGTLHEGDYITMINGISLRIDEKNKLDYCIRTISKCKSDYKITFFKKEDVDKHKLKFSRSLQDNKSQVSCPNAPLLISTEDCYSSFNCPSYDQAHYAKATFEVFHITIQNDGSANLGLVLFPSLNDPSRYVAITDIHIDSLVDTSNLLKINDEILSVNNTSFEFLSPSDAGRYLKNLMNTEETLDFKIRRLMNPDDECGPKVTETIKSVNKFIALSNLPDLYSCTLLRSQYGFGFSVLGLEPSNGVVIDKIDPGSSAEREGTIKSGHRIIMVNDVSVSTSSVDSIVKIVKNLQHSICLIMETTKFRELNVRVTKDSSNSLGLNVSGGVDTKSPFAMIESIVPDTMCQHSEQLFSEDLIIEANDLSMLNLDHDEIIRILRGLPVESTFKIWRRIPFWKREFFNNINSPSFMDDYLQYCQFSVIIMKPVDNIPSFGINFGDILVVDSTENKILQRYKAVVSIEKYSLSEKYAPQIISHCYLISVNKIPIDVTMSCDDLKKMIDCENQIELLLSKDIPYNTQLVSPLLNDFDRAIPLSNTGDTNMSDSEQDKQTKMVRFEDNENAVNEQNIEIAESKDNLVPLMEGLEINVDVKSLSSDVVENKIIEEESLNEDNDNNSKGQLNTDFGITIDVIVVNKTENSDLGFNVYGGIGGGPNRETLPLYVVGVEKNTCNWPNGQSEPFLNNGYQLLEMNGCNLSSLEASVVERLMAATVGDLRFKVVKLKI